VGPSISLPGSSELYEDFGFAYTETNKSTINDRFQEESPISCVVDGIYNMHYKEDPLSRLIQPSQDVINHRIKEYLSNSLGNLWDIDAEPFSRIVASYIGMPVWTHYLDWMYYWTMQKMDIKSFNLMLEYAFPESEIMLLKLPSHIAVEQNGWKITPMIHNNRRNIDPVNFTKMEPLLIPPLLRARLAVRQEMMKRVKPNYIIVSPVPKIFYSSSFSQGKLLLSNSKRRQAAEKDWVYSSLDNITISEGCITSRTEVSYDIDVSEPNLDDFTYCQLCDEKTFICSLCQYRDLLFCHIHSGMIKHEITPHCCKKCIPIFMCRLRW
jgi:hypothetical protein